MKAISIPSLICLAILCVTPAIGAETALPLKNAEDALLHFHTVSIPKMEAGYGAGEVNPVSAIRKASYTIMCEMVHPNFKSKPDQHGVRWPEKDYPIVCGSVEKVKESASPIWQIDYSTGFGNSLKAFVDSKTGETLLAYIIPEG